MSNDPLTLPATAARLRKAAAASQLPDRATTRAIEIATATPRADEWQPFLLRTLALLGAALVLAGVVCFVAYNWDAFGRFAKLGLVATGITVAALFGWRMLPHFVGQLSVAVAAVLVGPLLAVYGQTYQTGADPYGLFLTWLLLIVPWLVAAQFAPLWVFAVALLDLTLVLYWVQVRTRLDLGDWLVLPLLIAAAHATVVVSWELQLKRARPWFHDAWAAHTIAVTGWLALVIASGAMVVEPSDAGLTGVLAVVAFASSIAATWHYHRRVRRDAFMVAAGIVAAFALMTIGVGRIVFEDLDMEEAGALVMAVVVIAEVALGLRWYRRSRQRDAER